MKVISFVVVTCVLGFTFAEPPPSSYIPPNQYIPPPSSYGPPTGTYGPPKPQYGPPKAYLPPTEEATEPANYEFSYAVKDDESGNDFGHQEARQGDVAEGKYYVLLPDGQLQTVEYVADSEGYKPKVTYEQVKAPNGGGYPKGGPNGGYQY